MMRKFSEVGVSQSAPLFSALTSGSAISRAVLKYKSFHCTKRLFSKNVHNVQQQPGSIIAHYTIKNWKLHQVLRLSNEQQC